MAVGVWLATVALAMLAAASREGTFAWHNASIYTLDDASPYASALCAADGWIRGVGDASILESAACALSRGHSVDLRGATVVPGLTDSHAHLMEEAARLTQADLTSATSAEDMAQRAAAFARHLPAHKWVQGFGWDQTRWASGEFPTRFDVDALIPDRPAFLIHISGHAALINSAALARISPLPEHDPPGGRIERDASGRPTGILTDNAQNLALRVIPKWSDAEAHAALGKVLAECARHGLTGVHDLAAYAADIELYARTNLTLRVYAMRRADEAAPSAPHVRRGLLTVRAVKLFADGAMGSWTAAMLEPYADRPGERGTLVYSDAALEGNVSAWAERGYQVCTHAIGDAANRQVLGAYERVLHARRAARGGADAEDGQACEDVRWRVEHAQMLARADVGRFAALGVIPSMQPSHCASDLSYAERRLGPERAKLAYAWRSLLQSGVKHMPFGSDFPTAGTVPPLLGLHAAVTRQRADGTPAAGWHPEQRVTRLQALRGYTTDAAYASFREAELGRIAPGFRADLTAFDRDVLTCPAADLLVTRVLATVVGGRVVFSRGRRPSSSDRVTTRLDGRCGRAQGC